MDGMVPFGRRHQHQDIARRDPWDLRSWIGDFFNDSFFLPAVFPGGQPMRADVRETEKEYIIEADLPGVKKEEIKVDFSDDTLSINVEHNEQENEEKENYVRRERRYGSYSRNFYLGNVKHENVDAKFENGVLTITIPKAEEQSRKRSIDIH